MGNVFKLLFVVVLLGVPFLVISSLPGLFDLAAPVASSTAVPTSADQAGSPALRLLGPTPAASTRKFAALEQTPPPTLAPPRVTATPPPTTTPAPTGERVVIGNTDGRGAILRAEPVTGSVVGTLNEQQVVDVIERRPVAGTGKWVHVRTSDGREGWITALVALKRPS